LLKPELGIRGWTTAKGIRERTCFSVSIHGEFIQGVNRRTIPIDRTVFGQSKDIPALLFKLKQKGV